MLHRLKATVTCVASIHVTLKQQISDVNLTFALIHMQPIGSAECKQSDGHVTQYHCKIRAGITATLWHVPKV